MNAFCEMGNVAWQKSLFYYVIWCILRGKIDYIITRCDSSSNNRSLRQPIFDISSLHFKHTFRPLNHNFQPKLKNFAINLYSFKKIH